MKSRNLLLLFTFLFSVQLSAQEMRQNSTAMFSIVCPTHSDSDKENALISYNPTTHMLFLTTDIYEVIDRKLPMDSTFSEEYDGMPLSLSVKIDIPDLEFKTSKHNGETFTFNTLIQCNGFEQTIPVTYVYLFAPIVGQTATSQNFRLGFVVNINPSDFGFALPAECEEIIMKVQDAWLNKTTR